MPYGLHLADWDELLSDAEVDLFFQQIAIMNTAAAHTIFLHVHPKDIGRIWTALEAKGYQHVHLLFVYKPAHNTVGTHQYLNAVDQILVGYSPSRDAAKPRFSNPNPMFRHNLIYSHTTHHKRTMSASGESTSINVTEKHPAVSMQLGGVHCRPGGRALVVGAGSGSEVIGFNRAGLKVVGVEKDPRQFQAICARLVAEQEDVEKIDKQIVVQRKQIQAQLERTSHFQTKSRSSSATPEKADAKNKESSSSSSAPVAKESVPARRILPRQCAACGTADEKKLGKCSSAACTRKVTVHEECMKSCRGCGALFCRTSCFGSHQCPSRAPKPSSPKKPSSLTSRKSARQQQRAAKAKQGGPKETQ
jgi:hypothetical protein